MTTPPTVPQELIELEPCPFCGGPADIGEDECVHDVVFAYCTRCAAQGPFDADKDLAEATELWNTRTLTTNQTRLAELEEALRRLERIVGVTLDKDFGFWSSASQQERRAELYPAWLQATAALKGDQS